MKCFPAALILGILFFSIPLDGLSQTVREDPFLVAKGGLFKAKKVLQKSGFTLTQPQILEFMSNDPNMSEHVKPLRMLYLGEALLKAGGTIMVSWPLFQLEFSDKEPNLDITYIGLGLLVASAVVDRFFMKRAIRAADYYNAGYRETSSLRLRFHSGENGIGLALGY